MTTVTTPAPRQRGVKFRYTDYLARESMPDDVPVHLSSVCSNVHPFRVAYPPSAIIPTWA